MRKLTLMLVGTMSMMGAGAFALACSSDPAVVDGTGDDDDDGTSSSGNTSGGSGNTSGSSGAGASSSSGSAGCLAKLRPNADKGPFCPFLATDDPENPGANCATGQTCCSGRPKAGENAGFDESTCAASAAACPPPSDPDNQQLEAYECVESDDCTGGGNTSSSSGGASDAGSDGGSTSSSGGGGGAQVCCAFPNPQKDDSTLSEGTGTFDCHVLKGSYGTRCRSACADRELQVCQKDSDCSGGKSCVLASIGPQNRINSGICK